MYITRKLCFFNSMHLFEWSDDFMAFFSIFNSVMILLIFSSSFNIPVILCSLFTIIQNFKRN